MAQSFLTSAHVLIIGLLISIVPATNLAAAITPDADVIAVEAVDHGSLGWTFSVTVRHPDTGWDDYCNGWDVVSDQGVVLKNNSTAQFTRLLLHPHEQEQPFTRSQNGIQIPAGVKSLTIRAHDIVHGFGGKEVIIDLATEQGPGYKINRN